MAGSGAYFYGEWRSAEHLMRNIERILETNMNHATKKSASKTRDAMKKTIRNGDPSWAPNSPLTIAYKKSSKPLIDHGDFMNAMEHVPIGSGNYFIGVLKTAKNNDGVSFVDLFAVHEFGVTIRPKKAKALAVPVSREAKELARQYGGIGNIPGLFRPKGKKILAVSNNGALKVLFILMDETVIPPRPVISTTLNREENDIRRRWYEAASLALKGKKYV